MRQCPLCAARYDEGFEFCPLDNRVLLPADDLLGLVLGEKYRIESIVGSGGQGTVYRAVHLRLERVVALKVVRATGLDRGPTVDRFIREAQAVAQLRHPLIVTIYDFDVDPHIGAYLVMEYLEGHSLASEIQNRGRLRLNTALEFMRQICSGVHAAHLQGLVHRDLKPENIFIESRTDGAPSIKVLDFGVAKIRKLLAAADANELDLDASATKAGLVMGTPAYMAPEQCRARPLDARADVYSLGCVLFEMLIGQPPFGRGDAVDLMFKQCYDPPPVASELEPTIPASVELVLQKALAKRPEDRYQTADEMRQALNAVWIPQAHSDAIEVAPRLEPTGTTTAFGMSYADNSILVPIDDRTRHNLPATVNAFVGRENEIGAIRRLLESNRLISLTGPSGCGKTRLAIQAGAELVMKYRDGVRLVELAALSEPALVPREVASAIELQESPERPLLDQLRETLASKRMLLIIDNCEHLLGACAHLIATLLRNCPNVGFLVTSQQPLGVAGEVTWSVPMLSLPEAPDLTDVETALASEAVRLFVDRASSSNAGFTLTPENVPTVVGICQQLDGIPLAIELAAARVRMLPVDQIAARLESRFRLLTTGDRTAQPRQRTLQAAMDWSYDLLDEPERVTFQRLSVFAGGFTLDAAEQICSSDDLSSFEIFDALSILVDKSLVTIAHEGGDARYSMLTTIRHYGALKLQESGDASRTRSRHRDHFLAFAEEANLHLRGPEMGDWLERLECEHDNLRAALEWSQTDMRGSDAFMRLAGALSVFWEIRGHAREGLDWLERSLAGRDVASRAVLARGLHGAGNLARLLARNAESRKALEESLAIRREIGDFAEVAGTLNLLGFVAQRTGDYETAETYHAESLVESRKVGDRWEIGSALNNLGVIARHRGNYTEAVRCFEECLAMFREIGDVREVANALSNLGVLAGIQGDFDTSERLFLEGLELRRSLGNTLGIANSLVNLGEVALLKQSFADALRYFRESLTVHLKLDDLRGVAFALEGFVSLAVRIGRFADALVLVGAATMVRKKISAPLSPAEQSELDRQLEPARASMTEARAEELLAQGRTSSLRHAIDHARSIRIDDDPGQPVS